MGCFIIVYRFDGLIVLGFQGDVDFGGLIRDDPVPFGRKYSNALCLLHLIAGA